MATGSTILLVGDLVIDRAWMIGDRDPSQPYTLAEPTRDTDVAGGIGTVARAIGAVAANPLVVIGAWGDDAEDAFRNGRLVPPEGERRRYPIEFRRLYRTAFTSVRTRVHFHEPGGQRLERVDRNIRITPSSADAVDEATCWPDRSDVTLIVIFDCGYGIVDLPLVREQLARYDRRRTKILLRSSTPEVIDTLPWDVLALDLNELSRFPEVKPFDAPVTKQVNKACTYHPSLVEALDTLADKRGRNNSALLLNLGREGALLLHRDVVYPSLLTSSSEEYAPGAGADEVLLAHFALGLLETSDRDYAGRLQAACRRAVRASAAFAAQANRVDVMEGWCAPRVEIKMDEVEHAPPVAWTRPAQLANLRDEFKEARSPLETKRILMRNAGWYLDGFHTVDPQFGSDIVTLKQRIAAYVRSETPRRPFLAVLCGDPGAGKSTLAEALGRYSGCELISANAAQWTSPNELFEVCERIRTARMRGRVPLAFIDEVDAPFQSRDLYAKLLAPVWDGTYAVGGQTRTIGTPTVFILAGSNTEWRTAEALLEKASGGAEPKLQDLVSRLSTPPLQIPPLAERAADIAYLVASQVIRKFPRVNAAAHGIFQLFNGYNCRHGARSMSSVIEMFGPLLEDERFLNTSDFRWTSKDLGMHLKDVTKIGWRGNDIRIDIAP